MQPIGYFMNNEITANLRLKDDSSEYESIELGYCSNKISPLQKLQVIAFFIRFLMALFIACYTRSLQACIV